MLDELGSERFSLDVSFSLSACPPSSNSAINSALKTTSPAGFKTLEMMPSNGATTSKTPLSVSISAITSSCFTDSPSFLTQFAMVPSATDSGNVGDFISIDIILL